MMKFEIPASTMFLCYKEAFDAGRWSSCAKVPVMGERRLSRLWTPIGITRETLTPSLKYIHIVVSTDY